MALGYVFICLFVCSLMARSGQSNEASRFGLKWSSKADGFVRADKKEENAMSVWEYNKRVKEGQATGVLKADNGSEK